MRPHLAESNGCLHKGVARTQCQTHLNADACFCIGGGQAGRQLTASRARGRRCRMPASKPPAPVCKKTLRLEHGHLARILEARARDGTMSATNLGGGDLEVELAGEDAFLAQGLPGQGGRR